MGAPKRGAKDQSPVTFVAIDFETADRDMDSACAVGLVRVENWQIVDRRVCLIRPPRQHIYFSYLHGITWDHVKNEPPFGEVWPTLAPFLDGASFLAAHNASFDRSVLRVCCLEAGMDPPSIPFRCSMLAARQTWNIYPTKLPNVCERLGVPLNHHEAGSDAEACARIMIAAHHARHVLRIDKGVIENADFD